MNRDKRRRLARAERERVKKDAARYRWWRAHWCAASEEKFDRLNDVLTGTTPAEVDANIDGAIDSRQAK